MVDKNSSPLTVALITAIQEHDLDALDRALVDAAPADLDIRDERGFTPLIWAVRKAWLEAVERLLSGGADPNLGGSRSGYPLSESICRAHYEIATQLLRSPALNLSWQGFIAACDALLGGDLAGLDCLIEHGFDLRGPVPPQVGPQEGMNCASALLFSTISCGLPRPEVFERLISLGADPDTRSFGDTKAGLLCARVNEDPDVLRQLLQAGASVDELDATGYAPLHYAAASDHLESVRLLLEFGADPNLKATDGSFPLLWAASNNQGRVHTHLLKSPQHSPVGDNELAELPQFWHWDGGAAWGALELAEQDGAWHGVVWASDEAALLTELKRRYASLRGNSPLCLVVRQLRPPVYYPPDPNLRPREGDFKVGQTGYLHHYAPWFAKGINRPPSDPEHHRFVLQTKGSAEEQGKPCPVEIRQIVSFYEGWKESCPAVECRRQGERWQLFQQA